MKKVSFVILIAVVISCQEEATKETVKVGISEFSMPQKAKINDPIQIHAQASATSGCYHSLRLIMEKINDFEYSMNAYGIFESKNGTCFTVMVYKDSIFNFTPKLSGKYIFHVSEYKNKTLSDTLTVD